jgi:hypothetical protein
MNAAISEVPETAETTVSRFTIPDQARIVAGLLKEYSGKLAELNAELLEFSFEAKLARSLAPQAAWLLDQTEILRKPLSSIISRGSALLEYSSPEAVAKLRKVAPLRDDSYFDALTADELTLRMREIEIQLHHTLRLTHELRETIKAELRRTGLREDLVARLQHAAGLNAMKGGPLNPE